MTTPPGGLVRNDFKYVPIIWLVTMADAVGFEPTRLLHPTVFKTAALNHSAIHPFGGKCAI